jgi:hypothetical protein
MGLRILFLARPGALTAFVVVADDEVQAFLGKF